jgi:murein DD-endopeptidase MepM/ murein hydrolase activator NlpD
MKSNPSLYRSPKFLAVTSWVVTGLVVAGLLGFTLWQIYPADAQSSTAVTPAPTQSDKLTATTPDLTSALSQAIVEQVTLKIQTDAGAGFAVKKYTVQSGDSVFSIADAFKIKPETVLWSNFNTLQDDPDNLSVGQVLDIPPVDGVYYQVQDGDTIQSIADKFNAKAEDIINWPGNNLDLSNPVIKSGQYLLIPAGTYETVQWVVPQEAVGHSGTAEIQTASCSGGLGGTGSFIWPADNHYLSGYNYSPTHLGIDIADPLGGNVYAADSGVVVIADIGGWNGGYGNMIEIDHGNGYATVYGHLSVVLVKECQSVTKGQRIGYAGATGNATGPHLHFEIRYNGGFVDPWNYLP